jgi:hypothetical protein
MNLSDLLNIGKISIEKIIEQLSQINNDSKLSLVIAELKPPGINTILEKIQRISFIFQYWRRSFWSLPLPQWHPPLSDNAKLPNHMK